MKYAFKTIAFIFCCFLLIVSLLNFKKSNKSVSHPNKTILFAHKGLPQLAENSVQAFEETKALGFTALETDINVTKDHKLIIFHDKNTKMIIGFK